MNTFHPSQSDQIILSMNSYVNKEVVKKLKSQNKKIDELVKNSQKNLYN